MADFERIIQYLDKGYYGDLIMAIFELIAIITGFLFLRKDKTKLLFIVYLLADFLVLLSEDYIDLYACFSKKEFSSLINITNPLISFTELIVYYHFFIRVIHDKTVIKIVKVLRILFSIIMILFITTEFSFLTNRYSYVSSLIGVIEFSFLLLPCLTYYYELFKKNLTINLYQRPSFWIVTGIFFYSVISIPYYLINRFFSINHYENRYLMILLFFNIPFAINFIFLTRAFLFKNKLTI